MSGNTRVLQALTVLTEVHTLLVGLPYPASDNTGIVPDVFFLDDDDEKDAERIELVGQLSDGVVDWNATGGRQEEEMTITVLVYAGEHGQTGAEAVARADELAQVVQNGLRDSVTGQPTGITTPSVIKNYRIFGYDIEAFPNMNEGWGVMFSMNLRVTARI
tara:strand:+ start:33 stop:515 length:483 start_codon:yes stop_codon:yes gene_type:complete